MAEKKKLSPKDILAKKTKLLTIINNANRRLKKLPEECTHIGSVHYFPDPSGNNDSGYDC